MGALLHRAWDRPRARLLVVGVVATLIVAAAALWWFVWRSPDAGAATATQVTRTAEVSTTTIEKSVSASGTLTPSVQKDVSFAASGTVTAVKVEAGQTVKKGAVLATIDTLQLKADLLSAKADLATAESDLATAEDDDDGTDAAAAQVSAKKAAVEVAQAAVDDAEDAMDDATLTAPVAGLVTEVNIATGDAVTGTSGSGSGSGSSAGSGAGGGTGSTGSTGSSSSSSSSSAQFVIVGTDSWQVSVGVGEDDVAHVKKGEQVELTGDDLAEKIYGTVTSVGLLPSTSSGSVSYPVTVSVTGSPQGLHDGVSVTAAIVYERRTDVLAVPAAAVTTEDGASYVEVVQGEGTVKTKITTGETSGQMIEVTDGLTEGQSVRYTISTGTGNGGSTTQRGGFGELPGGGEVDQQQLEQMRQRFEQNGGSFPGGAGGSQGGGRG